jgi:hypothetical protein
MVRGSLARPAFGVALLATLAACWTAAPTAPAASSPPPAASTAVRAAYLLLVEGPDGATVPLARVIVGPGSVCPELVPADAGGARARAIATAPRRNPHGFAVRVCEAVVPFETGLAVAGSAFVLPAAHRSTPHRVAVFGDTGCKPQDQDDCTLSDPSEWPLATFAAAAAGEAPDLVLHVGDYNYRGTPSHFEGTVDGRPVTGQWDYDAGDGSAPSERCGLAAPYYSQNATGSSDPDAWEDWWLDFFQPAAPLLAAAPWVAARGNHELCSHAGPGWLYFLGPSSEAVGGPGAQTACPRQDGTDTVLDKLVFEPPYTVRLGDLAVSVLDTANACDDLPSFVDRYAGQLAALAVATPAPTHWLMMHRPIWGVDGVASDAGYDCAGEAAPGPKPPYAVINRTLSCAVDSGGGPGLLRGVDLALAGHMHRFEWLHWGQGVARPPVLIVGNGGVELETNPPQGGFGQPVDGEPASGFSLGQSGYVAMVRDGDAWHAEVVALDPDAWGGELPACGSAAAAGAFLCLRSLPPSS